MCLFSDQFPSADEHSESASADKHSLKYVKNLVHRKNVPQSVDDRYARNNLTVVSLKKIIGELLYRPKPIYCNYHVLSIIALFVEYLRQFLIDLHQTYRHIVVCRKTRIRALFLDRCACHGVANPSTASHLA